MYLSLAVLTCLFNNLIKAHHQLLLEEPCLHILLVTLPAPDPSSSTVRKQHGTDVSNYRELHPHTVPTLAWGRCSDS